MGTEHWFIDETDKARGLTLAVVRIDARDVGRCRVAMSRLTKLPKRVGSPLHFKHELNSTRAEAFRVIGSLPVTAALVTVPPEIRYVPARERAVRWIAQEAARHVPQRLVIEADDAAVANDRRWLRDELAGRSVEYLHAGKEEPLLWIADGIAWAYQRRNEPSWLRMIEHLIVERARA